MALPTIQAMLDANPGVPTDAAGPLGRLDPNTLAILIGLKEGEGGSAATIADGADVTQGAIADAAVTAGAAGTVNAHLRSISRDVAAIPSTANTSTTVATTAQGTKAVTAAGTPERLVASTTKVESVVIQALKGVATANTGNIYVGFSASGGSNLMVLTPGQSVTFEAPAGKKVDLTNIYIDAATSADAVQYTSIA